MPEVVVQSPSRTKRADIRPMESKEKARLTWTVDEAATLLGIGRNSCYEGIHRNEIPSVRIGRRLLVPCHALEKLLDKLNPFPDKQ